MGHYKEVEISDIRKILVCIFKYQGDVLLTSPIYRVLKRAYPHAEVHAYIFKDTYPMLEGHPDISKFHFFDQGWRKLSFFKRVIKEFSNWYKIRRERFDMVFNLTSGDRGALVARISGAKVRVGIKRGGGMRGKDRFFTQVIRETPLPRHMVERNLDLVRAVGVIPREEEKELFFFVPHTASEKIQKLVPFEDYIVIHPSSRCDYKHWSEEKFSQLIEELRKRGENIILSGGPGEEEKKIIESIRAPFATDPHVLSLQGKISLKELGALIKRSKLLISVDSVPPHIASSLKIPTLVLFGPSDDLKWGPWRNPRARVVRLDVPCKRCDMEGCGGTWMSDCLIRLPLSQVLNEALSSIFYSPSNNYVITL